MRYFLHCLTGLVVSGLWVAWTNGWGSFGDLACGRLEPDWVIRSCSTTEYWFGLFLVLGFLAARASHFTQKQLRGELPEFQERPITWLKLAGPYFAEVPSYVLAAYLLQRNGFGTLTVDESFARGDLLFLIFCSLLLAPICGTCLGWKTTGRPTSSAWTVVSAAYLTFATVPVSYSLNEFLIPETFPLLPVSLVMIGGLVFLFLVSRVPGIWSGTSAGCHPAVRVACFMPAAPLLLVFGIILFEGEFVVPVFIAVSYIALLACGPVYLLSSWVPLPLEPQSSRVILTCLISGAASCINLFYVGSLLNGMEDANILLILTEFYPYWLFGGILCMLAPLSIRRRNPSE